MSMRFGSVCSGIEAASVAWHPLGWRASFLSEIEAFPRAVLSHHFPTVPLHGDFTTIEAGQHDPIDLLVGGTPCQDFSVAGLRAGMAGDRGNLTLQFLTLARRLRPRWVVWENVPGVLSSNGGRDFGAFLGGLGELGYGWAYRTLDAQYFGVAQRRRRVFVVGCLGDWRRAAAVLFERHSLQGHPAPSREAGKGSAVGTLGGTSPGGGWRFGADEAAAGQLLPIGIDGQEHVGHALTATATATATGRLDPNGQTFVAAYRTAGDGAVYEEGDTTAPLTTGTDPSASIVAFSCKDHGADASTIAPTLRAMGHSGSHANAGGQLAVCVTGDVAHTLKAEGFDASEDGTGRGQPMVNHAAGVRRLTPRECERLQGFPDDWTLIPYRGKAAADGPRYKALGNSMAVPVMAWIGRRIQMVEALTSPAAAPAQAAE